MDANIARLVERLVRPESAAGGVGRHKTESDDDDDHMVGGGKDEAESDDDDDDHVGGTDEAACRLNCGR